MSLLAGVVLLLVGVAFGEDACDCQSGSWTYKGANFDTACAETSDWEGHTWCYVKDGANCPTAAASAVEGETRKWRECSSCNCQTSWDYKGADYLGCDETSDWTGHHWCYVQGGTACATAVASSVEGETRKWRECLPCNCQIGWNYKEVFYEGCAETADWKDHTWCYVQGGSKCPNVQDSSVVGENRKWHECTHSVTCGAAKAAYKKHDCCGNPNAEFDEDDLHHMPSKDCIGYGLTMTTLQDDQVSGMATPADSCYYPVTLPELLAAGELHYTYIGQSLTNEHAPDGAFVYKMEGGGLRYKKVELTDGTCSDGQLCFSCDHTISRLSSFEETKLMSKAMECSSDIISVEALKGTYSHYAWVQMPEEQCGSFIYQKADGHPLVHKTCG